MPLKKQNIRRPPAALLHAIMRDLLASKDPDAKALDRIMRRHLDKTAWRFPKIAELVAAYRIATQHAPRRFALERLLRCKTTRTDSGVAPITLLTKPYACPGKCVYCPTEARMPKSYVASEPAAARALSLKFDPWLQVTRRVEALERNGHEAKKIELIVKGGTWSAYPWPYRAWFIKRCFDAANQLGRARRRRFAHLEQTQRANETAAYRIIGLTIETRPDWVTPQEIERLRLLGVTRVELGVQATDDRILDLTQRGHTVADAVRATALLKAAGFKMDYHFMPGQPGSTPQRDVEMFAELFDDPRFRPDMVKLYPCVVLPSAELSAWHERGTFKPMDGETLIEAMVKMKTRLPRYCRLSRLIRDFPAFEISAGNLVTNLRDVIKERMRERGLACQCLRCREAGHRPALAHGIKPRLFVETYENAHGQEYFLSMEDPERTTVLGFLRLRLPGQTPAIIDEKTCQMLDALYERIPEIRGCAFVRELHTYGQALPVGDGRRDQIQHRGYGKRLLKQAERIARQHGFRCLSVISGVGVREYYRRLGYRRRGTYMIKTF